MEKITYVVLKPTRIDGKPLKPGDTIDLTARAAKYGVLDGRLIAEAYHKASLKTSSKAASSGSKAKAD